MRGKANLATFLATFCKVRRICHPGAARAFAFRYPLAARIVSQLGEKFFKAVVHVTLGTSLATSGPLAQYSELATDNRLVGSSSPPSPTTQSCTNGDFPVQCESPRISGDLCTHFISAICRLDCRDRFEVQRVLRTGRRRFLTYNSLKR